MRELVLLMAAVLAIGYSFSGDEDSTDPEAPACRDERCRRLKLPAPERGPRGWELANTPNPAGFPPPGS